MNPTYKFSLKKIKNFNKNTKKRVHKTIKQQT